MKFKKSLSKCMAMMAIAVACTASSAHAFDRPTASRTLSAGREDAAAAIDAVNRSGSESGFFANSLVLNGNDIRSFMSQNNCAHIAVYYGYSMSGNYRDANKVMMVVAVDSRYKVMPSAKCLLYNSSNMSFDQNNFGADVTHANSSTQKIEPPLAKAYIANFEANPNRDQIKGILIEGSTVSAIVPNVRSTGSDMRLSFGEDGGVKVVLVSSVDNATGTASKDGDMVSLDPSSLCPNNCDIY